MNDGDRADWVKNDEALYNWWKSERVPIRQFVRDHRHELTEYIEGRMNPSRPTGYHVGRIY